MAIVSAADQSTEEIFVRIRGLLGTKLTPADLSSMAIFNHAVFRYEERELIRAYPGAETATGDDRAKVLSVLEFRTAAGLLLVIQDILSEAFRQETNRYSERNIELLRSTYLSNANDELADLVPTTATGRSAHAFIVTTPEGAY